MEQQWSINYIEFEVNAKKFFRAAQE